MCAADKHCYCSAMASPKLLAVFLSLFTIGVLDRLGTVSSAGIRRLGAHQGKEEAYWLYFFISHGYDSILNPWHWTEVGNVLIHT